MHTGASEVGTNEDGITGQRQRAHVFEITTPLRRPEKVEFHIGGIEHSDRHAVALQKRGNRLERLRTGKIADHRNQPVFRLKSLQPQKVIFACQVTLEDSRPIRLKQQALKSWIVPSIVSSDARESQVKTFL